jgi:hypothetical protein
MIGVVARIVVLNSNPLRGPGVAYQTRLGRFIRAARGALPFESG